MQKRAGKPRRKKKPAKKKQTAGAATKKGTRRKKEKRVDHDVLIGSNCHPSKDPVKGVKKGRGDQVVWRSDSDMFQIHFNRGPFGEDDFTVSPRHPARSDRVRREAACRHYKYSITGPHCSMDPEVWIDP